MSTTTTAKAEFALAKALCCVRVTGEDTEMGIASYPYPAPIVSAYWQVMEPMDIACPPMFEFNGDEVYDAPPPLTPDQPCFSGDFRDHWNLQFERRRAFVRASWIARWETTADPKKAAAFATRASETLYTVSNTIGEAAIALATQAGVEEEVTAADAAADAAMATVPNATELPSRYTDILAMHLRAAAAEGGGAYSALGFPAASAEAAGLVCVEEVLRALVAKETAKACVGALAVARALACTARNLERAVEARR